MEYRFLQYPRGLNKGGTRYRCMPDYQLLIVAKQLLPDWDMYKRTRDALMNTPPIRGGGNVQGPIRESWILRHSIQHHYKSWQFTSLRNSRRMDRIKNNRGGRVIEVWSSLQTHRGVNREGICPTIGTTDFSLPRIVIEYEDNEF